MAQPKKHTNAKKRTDTKKRTAAARALTTTTSPSPKRPLSKLLLTLPQELYDEIYKLTFAIEEDTIAIDENYKPPIQLQITKAIRADFAARYYGNCLFFAFDDELTTVRTPRNAGTRQWTFSRWVESLPEEHRHMISRIEVKDRDWYGQTMVRRIQVNQFVLEYLPKVIERAKGA